jgi:hypothetical protein
MGTPAGKTMAVSVDGRPGEQVLIQTHNARSVNTNTEN